MRREVIETAETPDGGTMVLAREPAGYVINCDGRVLMTSRTHGSEEAMARIACHHLKPIERPRMLIGGLGLGFTLRAALDRLPAQADVVCVELMEAIVEWHRGPLGEPAARPIDDPRVRVVVRDVGELIREVEGDDAFDAILLDVDNGPIPMTVVGNWWLYAAEGIAALHRALRPGGTLVVWSANDDDRFAQRMVDAGFDTEVVYVAARTGRRKRGGRGQTHVLLVGRR